VGIETTTPLLEREKAFNALDRAVTVISGLIISGRNRKRLALLPAVSSEHDVTDVLEREVKETVSLRC
jgi:phosphopantothenate synthetase